MSGAVMELTEDERELQDDLTGDETPENGWKLSDLFTILRSTENLSERQFVMVEDAAQFALPEEAGSTLSMVLGGEYKQDEDNKRVLVGGERFGVTQDCYVQAAKEIGLTPKYAENTPIDLMLRNLNYWFNNLAAERKALIHGTKAVSIIRPGTVVYSTIDLVTAMVEELEGLGHTDLFFDKVSHSIDETQFVLVINDWERTMPNGDTLKGGFQFQNSILAKKPLLVTPVLWFDSAGLYGTSMSDLNHAQWNRKLDPSRSEDDPFEDALGMEESETPYDVYQWMHSTVKDLYGTLNREAQLVQNLSSRRMGAHAGSLVNDIFTRFRVPAKLQEAVTEEYAGQQDQTLYDLWKSVATVAGGEECTEKLNQQRHMMLVAGAIAAHPEACNSCHRLTVEG